MFKRWLATNGRLWLSCFFAAALLTGCDKSAQPATGQITPYEDLRQQVVDRVQKGVITPDAAGIAILPDDVKDAAPDSRVIVAHDPALGLLVAFNLSINPSSRPEYLIYSEKDIQDQTKAITVGSLQLNIGRKSKDHWYQAVPAVP